jgi:hypothetical protein
MFDNVPWQTVAALGIGLAVVGLVVWVSVRKRAAPSPTDDEPKSTAPERAVSWTSMVARGGYDGKTKPKRRAGGSVDVLIADEARKGSPVEAWVVERTVSAMTLMAQGAFGTGSVAKVRPLHAGDDVPWCEIEIHECTQEEDEWKIACKFVKVPPYSVLMLFG